MAAAVDLPVEAAPATGNAVEERIEVVEAQLATQTQLLQEVLARLGEPRLGQQATAGHDARDREQPQVRNGDAQGVSAAGVSPQADQPTRPRPSDLRTATVINKSNRTPLSRLRGLGRIGSFGGKEENRSLAYQAVMLPG